MFRQKIHQVILLITLFISSGLTLPASATELKDAQLDWSSLKNWGTQTYTFGPESGDQQAATGEIILKTDVQEEKIVLNDIMRLAYRGELIGFSVLQDCRKNNFFSPTRIKSKGTGTDEVGTFELLPEAKDKTVKVTVEGKTREVMIDIPPDTVTDAAMWRLVTLLPTKAGESYTFKNWLEISELNQKKDFTITCLGEETITRGDEELACTKFRVSSKQIHDADYWVKDGLLERALIDGRKLLERQPAKQ